jgi:ribA/ribD-fused uncharacterized protein
MKTTDNFVFFFTDKDVFSNWHPSPFSVKNVNFTCAEQYMMYCKAKVFGDHEVADKIIASTSPKEQKALGRSVRGYDDDIWRKKRLSIVVVGLIYKFEQNPSARKLLIETNGKTLVEASPYDKIWGVGLAASDPNILDPSKWKGQNLLGKALMKVREVLIAKEVDKKQASFSSGPEI